MSLVLFYFLPGIALAIGMAIAMIFPLWLSLCFAVSMICGMFAARKYRGRNFVWMFGVCFTIPLVFTAFAMQYTSPPFSRLTPNHPFYGPK